MAMRLFSPLIQWILFISMAPWLLAYGWFSCRNNETMKTTWCGEIRLSQRNCKTIKCVQRGTERITQGYVLWSNRCHGGKYPKYGYKNNYIWTTDCCLLWARICYQGTSVDSDGDLTEDDHTSHGQTTTKKTTDFWESFTTPIDIFNSTGIEDMVEQTIPAGLEIKAEEYTETKSSMIGLYAGLPVGLILCVAVLAVVCYIFRDKLKTVAGKFRKANREEMYHAPFTTSKPSTGNDISKSFDNQQYAMYDDQEYRKSEDAPMEVSKSSNSWSKAVPNISFHHNPAQTEANSSYSKYRPEYEDLGLRGSGNTYNTLCQAADPGRIDPFYDHIQGSNLLATEAPQGRYGGTEYDNAVI